jgi:signal transduction histidine kinase
MKNFFLLIFFNLGTSLLFANQKNIDSLIAELKKAVGTEQQISILKQLSSQQNDAETIIKYAQQGIVLSRKSNLPFEEEYFLYDLCRGYHKNDDYPKELETSLAGLKLSRQLKDEDKNCGFSMIILVSYDLGKQYNEGLPYGFNGLLIAEKTKNRFRIEQLCDYIAQHFMSIGNLDSALIYMRRSNQVGISIHDPNIGFSTYGLGVIQEKLHHTDSALFYYERAVPAFKGSNIFRSSNLIDAYTGIAGIYKNESQYDSALYYAKMAYQLSKEINQINSTYKASEMLASLYEGVNDKESLYYYKIAVAAKDSMITADKTKQMLALSDLEQRRQQELLDSMQRRRNLLLWMGAIFIFIIIVIFFYRRYQLKRQLEIERIRSNIAADFHDELGSTLSSIALYTEIAGKYDFSSKQETRDILSQIGESSRRTISAMQDMIWSIQPKNDTMQDVIYRMREYAFPLAELKNIHLIFKVEKEVQDLTTSMESRKNIYLIFKEALNNAFKYSSANNITINIGVPNQLINLEIKDDGRGFDTLGAYKGNGLRNMHKRTEQMGGNLLIKSGPQTGTSILFTGILK